MTARLTLTVSETAAALGISRTAAYDLIRRNHLPHIRIGRAIRIPTDALAEWVRSNTTTTKAGNA